MPRLQDLFGVLRGFQTVAQAGLQLQEQNLRIIWANSSAKLAIASTLGNIEKTVKSPVKPNEIINTAAEGVDRISTVLQGIKDYTELSVKTTITKVKDKKLETTTAIKKDIEEFEINLSAQDKALLKKLDMELEEKLRDNVNKKEVRKKKIIGTQTQDTKSEIGVPVGPQAIPHSSARKLKLNPNAKQRTVPATRIGRMVSFGSLAAGLGIGTAAEFARRTLGVSKTPQDTNIFLSPANTERIVDTLCKVRGAALKIGQILSIQDESIVSPELAKAFSRVRQSADFMPIWQVEKVLNVELGVDWRSNFQEFEMKPFAAASIGQVHFARTADGKEVAIKIQYPGVARGINSDIDNLVGIMKVWNIFPEGMFIDNVVIVAKRELAWEVDYIREAECTRTFKKLLQPYPEYYVPNVIDNLSKNEILTTELIDGMPLDECFNLDEQVRKDIAQKAMRLTLMEILEFQYMQTDPNWANFFYNNSTKQLILLDFGASRDYSKTFMDIYVKIMKSAADGDREGVLEHSKDLGFFTGYESKIMEEAHVDATMHLGEIYRQEEFDFANQQTTKEIQELVPTMLAHRLCPPPEEIYSLHRKLSGDRKSVV